MAARRQVDEETRRYIDIRRVKLRRLHELDRQAAAYGEFNVPPHIQMERTSLQDELGMVETAINAPARAEIGDQLGASGRFLVYHQQNREIKQSIAALAVRLEEFITQSLDWRMKHRQWLLVISIAVLFILVITVAFIAYEIGRSGI